MDDTGRDSSLGRRDALLVLNPAFLDSEVEMVAPGEFYLVTQSRLMQDYVHSPDGGAPREIEGYRVSMTIRDGNDQPASGFITVALNNPELSPPPAATLYLNDGTQVTLDSAHPQAHLPTGTGGVVSFTLAAAGQLTCPTLRVQADFMTDGSWLVVAPDRQAHAALASITGNDLRGRDVNGDPLPDKPPVLPAASAETANATAQAISQLMRTAVQSNAQGGPPQMRKVTHLIADPVIRPYVPRYQMAGIIAAGHDPVTDAIATHHVDQDVPVARILNPASAQHAHWAFDGAFAAHDPQRAAQEIGNLSPAPAPDPLTRKLLPTFLPGHITGELPIEVSPAEYASAAYEGVTDTAALSSWLRDHITSAARILVNTVTVTIRDGSEVGRQVACLVLTAVDKLEQAAYAIVQTVEHAVDAIAGLVQKVGGELSELVTFLKELFAWGDVLNTHQMIYTYVTNLKPFIIEVLQDAAKGAIDVTQEFKDKIDGQIEQWRDTLMKAGGQGVLRDSGTAPPANLKGGYVADMTRSGMRNAAGNPSRAAAPSTASQGELEQLGAELGTEWLAAIGDTWADLPGQIINSPIGSVRNLQTLLLDGVEVLLDTLKALADAFADCVGDLIAILERRLAALVSLIFKVIDEPIEIPLVSAFYEHVIMRGNGQKLSALSLASLLAAMSGTFAYKLTHGNKAPFSAEDVETFKAMPPSDYTWLVNPLRTRPSGAEAPSPPGWVGLLPYFVNMSGSAIIAICSTINDAVFFVTAPRSPNRDNVSQQIKYGWYPGKLSWEDPTPPASRILQTLLIGGNLLLALGSGVTLGSSTAPLGQAAIFFGMAGLGLGIGSFAAAMSIENWTLYDTYVGLAAAALNGISVILVAALEMSSSAADSDSVLVAISGACQTLGGMAGLPKLAIIYNGNSTPLGLAMVGLDGLGWAAAAVINMVLAAMTLNPLDRPAYEYSSRYCAELDMA